MSAEQASVLAVMDARGRQGCACTNCGHAKRAAEMRDARAAVAELIEADKEYDKARRDWDHVTTHDPEETSDETWQRVADRFERAVIRRGDALARVQGGES